MRLHFLILINIFSFGLLTCSAQKVIEIPLTQKSGYGHFHSGLGGISTYSEDEDNPWEKTYLTVSGVPENWSEVEVGDIETDIYQSVYQDHLLGNITPERYEELQSSWGWEPDTLKLSKEPLKTKIAFVYGKDSTGQLKMIVDANNNLDFSDDNSFVPFEKSQDSYFSDSIALSNVINVSYERLSNNKKVLDTAPLFIAYLSDYGFFTCNFPQYSIANVNGEKIAVCSDNFTSLSYNNPRIVLINDNLNHDYKISYEELTEKNEFIEIKGTYYRNIGVNTNSNTLILEKIETPINELYSTQVGFKSYSFEGDDFITESHISSQELKAKYVLIDFWAVWCGPCRKEIPFLKELYEKTDRENFEIISIVGESSPENLRKLITKESISWPQILSTEENQIRETFGVNGYPTTFLLNSEGIIIAKNLRGRDLVEKVMELVNE